VNQLLLAHANWGRFIDEAGAIRTTKEVFNLLLNAASDETLETSLLKGADTPKAFILAKHGVLSLNTVLDFVRCMAMYGGFAKYNEIESQGKIVITLMHDMPRKGSVFFSNLLNSLFGMLNIRYKFTSSEHAVIIEIQNLTASNTA
jgi:hypothetical protein